MYQDFLSQGKEVLREFNVADRQDIFFSPELNFADQKGYKNLQIVNILKIFHLCFELILIM